MCVRVRVCACVRVRLRDCAIAISNVDTHLCFPTETRIRGDLQRVFLNFPFFGFIQLGREEIVK